uniref:AB hydrolase-1 domain-containing protein n=1 Tax=Glossina austeni TaxID=7395 RepID=A0A1A9VT75_GLOAU
MFNSFLLQPIPALAIIALGTGNDLSRVGWDSEPPSILDPIKIFDNVCGDELHAHDEANGRSDQNESNGATSVQIHDVTLNVNDDSFYRSSASLNLILICICFFQANGGVVAISNRYWQDNWGTFDRLCPLMPAELPILCIDLPGHGRSSHYLKGMRYFLFWDGICLIRRIVRKFNWKNITLMGHSFGGAVSFMYAASFLNDVDKFISIDIADPTIRNSERLVNNVGLAIDKFLDYEGLALSKVPCYSEQEMVKPVMEAYDGSVDEQCVQILLKCGMETAAQLLDRSGYHFVRDVRLKVSSLAMIRY